MKAGASCEASLMQKLYSRSNPLDCAYLATGKAVYVTLPGVGRVRVPADRIVVGSLEHFLGGFAPRNETRLFDLYVESDADLKRIPFSTVDKMMSQFKFGYNTNIFLARLIEITNQTYQQRSRKLPRSLWQYQIRAERFARLTDQMAAIAEESELEPLQALTQSKRQCEIYLDGVILCRQNILRSISVPIHAASPNIQKLPKNACLCREGTAADSMFILLDGSIGVATGGRQFATISEQGEAFGELALFLDGRRTATLVALEDSLVFELKRTELARFFRGHRDLFRTIALTLARRAHDNIERIARFEEKLADLERIQRQGGGKHDWLEVRSRNELTQLCRELLAIYDASQEPRLGRLLEAYSISRKNEGEFSL